MFNMKMQALLLSGLLLLVAAIHYYAFVTLDNKIMALESDIPEGRLLHMSPVKAQSFSEPNKLNALFDTAIPERPHLPRILNEISGSAHATGISKLSIASESSLPVKLSRNFSAYAWPVSVAFEGNYYQLAAFVHALESLEREVAFLEIDIEQGAIGIKSVLHIAAYSRSAPPPLNPSKPEAEAFENASSAEDGYNE